MIATRARSTLTLRAIALTVLATAGLVVMLGVAGCGGDDASVPGDVEAARALYEQGDFEQATADLEAIIEDDEGDLEARRVLALSLAAQGDNEGAIEQYAVVIEKDAEDHTSLYRVALLERLTGDAEGAIVHFEQAIVIEGDTTYHDELARTLMQVGRFEDAATLWGKVLDDEALPDESRVEVLILQADAYSNARKYDEAKATLEKALMVDPNHETVKARLAELNG